MSGRGWTAVGMDWNASNAEKVGRELGLETVGGEHALDELDAQSFDVITLFHVLEHEPAPRTLLGKVNRLLAPGGRLVVGVPNERSLTRRLYGHAWMGHDLPRHRYVFSPESLRTSLEATRFRVERVANRFSDELLDVGGSTRLAVQAGPRLSRNRFGAVVPAAAMAAMAAPIAVCDLVRKGSVIYAYASKS